MFEAISMLPGVVLLRVAELTALWAHLILHLVFALQLAHSVPWVLVQRVRDGQLITCLESDRGLFDEWDSQRQCMEQAAVELHPSSVACATALVPVGNGDQNYTMVLGLGSMHAPHHSQAVDRIGVGMGGAAHKYADDRWR